MRTFGKFFGLGLGLAFLATAALAAYNGNGPFNIGQWAGTNLGSPSNYGTSPGAVAVQGVNAFVTNTAAVNVSQIGGTAVVADPCRANAKLSLAISQAAGTQLIAGTSAKKTYICSMMLVSADAENVSLVAGTGTVCATGISAVIGGTTAAAGPNLAANGGWTLGAGTSTVAIASNANADNVCLLQSGSGRVAGVLTYVQQ